jgi:DNA-binding CsgD family transcriptional regulator
VRVYAKPGTKPTRRELAVARAVLDSETMSQAAAILSMSERHLRVHLANLRVRLGARHNPELFYMLRDHLAA